MCCKISTIISHITYGRMWDAMAKEIATGKSPTVGIRRVLQWESWKIKIKRNEKKKLGVLSYTLLKKLLRKKIKVKCDEYTFFDYSISKQVGCESESVSHFHASH